MVCVKFRDLLNRGSQPTQEVEIAEPGVFPELFFSTSMVEVTSGDRSVWEVFT